MKISQCKIRETSNFLTARSGLMRIAELLQNLGFDAEADVRSFPNGSWPGYTHCTDLSNFVMALHKGGCRLEEIRHLCQERGLMSVFWV